MLLIVAGLLFAPSSLHKGALEGMLPFAAVLAIVALGQTLVVMQGGIDLSVAGSVSMVVVIVTHEAYGNDAQVLPAALCRAGCRDRGRPGQRLPDRAPGAERRSSRRWAPTPCSTPACWACPAAPRDRPRTCWRRIAGGTTLGVPNAVYFAIVAATVATVGGQAHGRRPPLRGGGRERRGRLGDRPAGAAAPRPAATSVAQVLYWLGGVLLAGILNKPTAYQGDSYLLASVAAVVLGGTSLLGGRGNLVATALAALFLIQLDQFVLALGVDFAVQTLSSPRRSRSASRSTPSTGRGSAAG